jgi:flagellar biosynthesis/type III secretory pathway M-ring protein FliF/YscJ
MVGYITAIVPSIGVLAVFWLVIRSVIQADRRERQAEARAEAAERKAMRGEAPAGGKDITD